MTESITKPARLRSKIAKFLRDSCTRLLPRCAPSRRFSQMRAAAGLLGGNLREQAHWTLGDKLGAVVVGSACWRARLLCLFSELARSISSARNARLRRRCRRAPWNTLRLRRLQRTSRRLRRLTVPLFPLPRQLKPSSLLPPTRSRRLLQPTVR